MSEMLKNLKEILSEIIKDSSNIFIVGHNEPDFDSIGSAIGLATICKFLGKEVYIIVNDVAMNLEPGVRKVIDENRGKYNIIDIETFEGLIDENSSLIITDTNKDYLLSVKAYLDDFKYKIIIDHHAEDQHTVDADYKVIEPTVSSASEMVAQLLNSYRFHYDCSVANYLLAGIELDTNRYRNNTTSKTHDVARKLINRGANPTIVTNLFRTEFETDRRINDLVYNGSLFETYERTIFQTRQVSFTLNRQYPATVYKKEDLAKAADKMLDYDMDASFVLGYVTDGLVSISARSKSDIDVGNIMGQLGGGGNGASAACKIITADIASVEEKLKTLVSTTISESTCDEITEVTVHPLATEITSKGPLVKVKA